MIESVVFFISILIHLNLESLSFPKTRLVSSSQIETHLEYLSFLGKHCVFHASKDNAKCNGNITLFDERTLEKCIDILTIRREKHLKYNETILPANPNHVSGFHMECYRKFTAIGKNHVVPKKDSNASDSEKPRKAATRSSTNNVQPESNSGVLPHVCIFCKGKHKKHNGKAEKLILVQTEDFVKKITKFATLLNDAAMLVTVTEIDFITKCPYYHGICRTKYQTEAEKLMKKDNKSSHWQKSRDAHSEAFAEVSSIVEDSILVKKEVALTADLANQYNSILDQGYQPVSTQDLERKLTKKFEGKIVIQGGKTRKGNLLFSNKMSIEEALKKESMLRHGIEKKLKDAALHLRNVVKEMESSSLLDLQTITINDIMNGEIKIPDDLKMFFRFLVIGPRTRDSDSFIKEKRIESICSDTIYAMTSGRKKPAKHLKLGMAVKSMSGSRKLMEVLNRYGSCCSYTTAEELETEVTLSTITEEKISPPEMIEDPSLPSGSAHDNFDRFVDTLSGKDTLHDTVGIAFQRVPAANVPMETEDEDNAVDAEKVPEVEEPNNSERGASNSSTNKRKRRRRYEAANLDIEPYYKKPKIKRFEMVALDDPRRLYVPHSITTAKTKDTLWMVETAVNPTKSTPLWVGWNAKKGKPGNEPLDKIWYLPQINKSPTSTAVVKEVLERSKKMMQESGKPQITVTFDLAIAKMAMEIQREETPTYDDLFIGLGAFHIELSFFKALGKYIADSGAPHIIAANKLIEEGSLMSFLLGTNYKRCKRVHTLLALAMEILHFAAFQITLEEDDLLVIEDLKEFLTKSEEDDSLVDSLSADAKALLDKYNKFTDKTRKGEHGKTAQYWIQHVDMMKLYHQFIRSIRTGDFYLYVSCMPKLSELFFTFNHQNYARWLTIYHDNLMKLDETHPAVFEEFQKGGFGLKRTSKPFSRIPIDLTLEQTINADAACQRSGVVSITNSISARQRWAQSHSIRVTVVSQLYEDLGLTSKEDVSDELRPCNLKKNNKSLTKLLTAIPNSMNPFSSEIDKDHLFNISTGKAAKEETSTFLLDIGSIGRKKRESFIQACCDDPSAFIEPIKKTKLKTFATENGLFKVSSRLQEKITSVAITRDLFGSILFHALQSKIDMAEVLSYPLTPVPLMLCHVNGTMKTSPKSKLLKNLEKLVESKPPKTVTSTIIDGMFLLHLLDSLPSTFGGVARYLLKQVCKHKGIEIHLVFDKTISPSIKDCERDKRSAERRTAYQITGGDQARPTNWLKAMRQDDFKVAFVKFLVTYWTRQEFKDILGLKTVFVNCEDKCYSFKVDEGIVVRVLEEEYHCNHEEADTRMIFHLSKLPEKANVIIRTADTDVLAITLGSIHLLGDMNIWMEVGKFTDNSLRFIDVTVISKALGDRLCKALPAFHAFTGI